MHIINGCDHSLSFGIIKHDRIKDELAKFLRKKFGDNTVSVEHKHKMPDGKLWIFDILVDFGNTAWIIEVKSPWDADEQFDHAYDKACFTYLDAQLDLMQTHGKTEVAIYPFVVGSLGRWHPTNNFLLAAIGWNDDDIEAYATRIARRNIEMCAKHYNQHLLYISNDEIIRDGTA